jgi:ribonuclease P protein component
MTTERRGKYPKEEHLKSKKAIDYLFKDGDLIKAFPIRMVYKYVERSSPKESIKAGVSVSKRKFKKAVDRNRVKRLMREALRYQKTLFQDSWEEKDKTLQVFFIYVSNEMLSVQKLDKAFAKCFKKLHFSKEEQTE